MFESECKILYQDYDKKHLKRCLKVLKKRQQMDPDDELAYHINYLEDRIYFLAITNSRLERLRNWLVESADLFIVFFGILMAMLLLYILIK